MNEKIICSTLAEDYYNSPADMSLGSKQYYQLTPEVGLNADNNSLVFILFLIIVKPTGNVKERRLFHQTLALLV